ncbi:Methyltransferase domain-containing protein [Ralstonia sp. 25mfcol4.1]|uniref:class I SAM-dependent methyltransferase n=1 Tax=Burkholderiaceae TaxID=119060 RepID=UPI00088E6F02|nr:class I SAM-dependent methyltransferase [Ralstonia sp. 25mfcol4.1]SDO99328.1 Methyltransferase domain-containing protein [Ralstonia sp. 25mfcol4.1]
MHSQLAAPSTWLTRWAHLIRPGGRVLDLACGSGRHAAWLAGQGFAVLAVDRDAEAVAGLPAGIEGRVADLEQGAWPLADAGRFDAVVVTNYLHRPLWPYLLDALAPGGVLIYETFAAGNETVGKPSRPDFLLRPGELLEVTRGTLRVTGYEDGTLAAPREAFVQRICAVREAPRSESGAAPPRYPLPSVPCGSPRP